jgi:hypothetical protein
MAAGSTTTAQVSSCSGSVDHDLPHLRGAKAGANVLVKLDNEHLDFPCA